MKICPNKGHIFKYKLKYTLAAVLKPSVKAERYICFSLFLYCQRNITITLAWVSIYCESNKYEEKKKDFTSMGKSMTELKFAGTKVPGTREKMKPRQEPRKRV